MSLVTSLRLTLPPGLHSRSVWRYGSRQELTASAGVSYNKFLAKLASDINKPDGITIVTPQQGPEFIACLPVGRFYGVGRATEKKMQKLGIETGADLLPYSLGELLRIFGKAGRYFYDIARGVDRRPVVPDRVQKSLGKETTLGEDLSDRAQMLTIIGDLAERLAEILAIRQVKGQTLTLKVRYSDFSIVTRSLSRDCGIGNADEMVQIAENLLSKTDAGDRPVRLLGLILSNLGSEYAASNCAQLSLPFPSVLGPFPGGRLVLSCYWSLC